MTLKLGQSLVAGRYEVKAKLGQGGGGAVYLVQEGAGGPLRALKIAARPDDVERLEREARVAAKLRHPAIAKVYGLGVDEALGLSFILMEYIEGKAIRQRLGGYSLEEAGQVLAKVCAGMEHAHGKGVVHRDLSPSNVIVGPDGTVKIIDFGLAVGGVGSGVSAGSVTTHGKAVGTPGYLAPELASLTSEPTPSADIYSLGALAYAMIAGGHPFEGHPLALKLGVQAACRLDPEPLSKRTLKRIPPALDAFLLKVISRNTTDRPQSAQDFFRGYSAAIAPPERPISPGGAGDPSNQGKVILRGSILIAVSGCLVLIGILLATYGPLRGAQAPATTPPIESKPQQSEQLDEQVAPTPAVNTVPLAKARLEIARQGAEIKVTMRAAQRKPEATKKAKPSVQKIEITFEAVPAGEMWIGRRYCVDFCRLHLTPGAYKVKVERYDEAIYRTVRVTPKDTYFTFQAPLPP